MMAPMGEHRMTDRPGAMFTGESRGRFPRRALIALPLAVLGGIVAWGLLTLLFSLGNYFELNRQGFGVPLTEFLVDYGESFAPWILFAPAVFFLGRLGIVQLRAMAAGRKFVFFGIVIFAAVITPADVFSQLALAVPMYLLYELGLILLKFWPQSRSLTTRS